MTPSQQFVYLRTYSRWLADKKRRENYGETSSRYVDFISSEVNQMVGDDVVTEKLIEHSLNSIIGMEVMPSMRAMWSAGEAAKSNNVAMYNCSYLTVNSIRSFSEAVFILMSGAGVGFSVESRYVNQLPELAPKRNETMQVVVEDSKFGWANSVDAVLGALWTGYDVDVDYSKIRPKGTRLVTMGGRASGPGPLIDLVNFCVKMFEDRRARKQRRLTTLDCHDIMNKIAEIVVMGGVRRSSELSLSDLDDRLLAEAKLGDFPKHRYMSNNSAVYYGRPDVVKFFEEFATLIQSRAGERGIFNRSGAQEHITSNGRRQYYEDVGVNPCSEIVLRAFEMCNLSEVVVRPSDNLESLRRKVKTATMFGMWQSMFIDFPYLREEWKKNCEEERLLGVSLTGIMDHPVLNNVNDKMKKWLGDLKGVALNEAEKWSKKLNINMPAAVTCVKPSGTVSQLVNCSSGISPRHAEYYIRRYRISVTDPLYKLLKVQGMRLKPEVGQDPDTASTWVAEFPIAAPGSKTRHDMTARQQLDHWKVFKNFWCEHNPSVTINVADDEWPRVAAWVYDNFDDVCGLSFFPKSDHIYQLAPEEEVTKEQYSSLVKSLPKIDYTKLSKFEQEDNTEGAKTYACSGDQCSL